MEAVKDHYERFPYPDYPLWFAGRRSELKKIRFKAPHLSKGWEPEHIWLVGCGALSPLLFARAYPRSHIRASDLSAANLTIAQVRSLLFGYPSVDFRQEDFMEAARSIDLQEKFDLIDAYGVIHHTENPEQSLSVLKGCLRSGGLMRVMVYSSDDRIRLEELRRDFKQKEPVLYEEVFAGAMPGEIQSLRLHINRWQSYRMKRRQLANIQAWLRERKIELGRDAETISGLADAILHPVVKVAHRDEWMAMLERTGFEILSVEDRANLVALVTPSQLHANGSAAAVGTS